MEILDARNDTDCDRRTSCLCRHPAMAELLTHYGYRVVPFVLIGLGIYILLKSRSETLILDVQL